MDEIIEKEKLPWPSRLSNSSVNIFILGIIIYAIGISISFIEELYVFVLISYFLGSAAIVLSLACTLVALAGLLYFQFKIPGISNIICVLVIGILSFGFGMAIFAPSLNSPPNLRKTVACRINIRALSQNCISHCNEHKQWPLAHQWCDVIKPYCEEKERNTFQCPKDKIGPCSYAMNENIPPEAMDLPPDLVLLFESAPGWNQVGGPEDVVTDRHDSPGANIAFADGYVEFVNADDIPKLRWTK